MPRSMDRHRQDKEWTPDIETEQDKLLLERLYSWGFPGEKSWRVEGWERRFVRRIMKICRGSKSQAARICKMNRSNFVRLVRKVK